jgi:hypothetical protein
MDNSHLAEHLVVRLLDGRSEQRELVLEDGVPHPPVVLGSAAAGSAWHIDAGHVAAQHVVLAYNGRDLYVGAARGEAALLDGAPLGARWVVASVPCELRFGSARVSVRRRPSPPDAAPPPPPPLEPTVVPRSEEKTSIDDARLAAALRLSIEGHRLPVPAPPPPLPPPLPPLRRPPIRPTAAGPRPAAPRR